MLNKIINYKSTIRLTIVLLTAILIGWQTTVYASDYKYKINDPKYNTSVQIVNPSTFNESMNAENPVNKQKQRRQLLIILSMIVIPGLLIFHTLRQLEPKSKYRKKMLNNKQKEVMKTAGSALINVMMLLSDKTITLIKNLNENSKNNLSFNKNKKIEKNENPKKEELSVFGNTVIHEEKLEKKQASENKQIEKNSISSEKSEQTKNIQKKSDFSINEYLSTPIQKTQSPMLISSSKLTKNKGVCLVQYKDKTSLIGYINKKVFVLAQFNSLSTKEIRTRLAEYEGEKKRYIVKLGNYKALLEVSENNMELLLEL